jgi:pentatricopeptide repeat protein
MSQMEAAELYPNSRIYNSILHAFSRACDVVGAEFYLREMRRKKIVPNVGTLNAMLNTYARAQSVGVKPYGYRGR